MFDGELLTQARTIAQRIRREPFRHLALCQAQRCLLQRLQRHVTSLRFLELFAIGIGTGNELPFAIAQLLNFLADVLQLFSGHLARGRGLRLLLLQGGDAHFDVSGSERRQLLRQTFTLAAQASELMLELFDTCALDLGLLARCAGLAIEILPALLPLLHGLFGKRQRFGG